MKKLSLLAILLGILVFVLIGCGTDQVKDSSAKPTEQAQTKESTEPAKQPEAQPTTTEPAKQAKEPVDHSAFFNEPFKTGQDVTNKCITCHDAQATEMLNSEHWKWQGTTANVVGHENDQGGKIDAINAFCISIAGNESVCTKCHVGYGWTNDNPDYFNEKSNIDCLVCHDTTGTYVKSTNYGEPDKKVDLLAVAQKVGTPSRDNCGVCHFYAGGGDAVKSPGMDSSLKQPTPEHDVHMGGQNMLCQDCHTTENHKIAGASVHLLSSDGVRSTCEDCHTETPHKSNDTLNKHTSTVACQTCHIPTFAVEQPTKMSWDWSTAGKDVKEPPKDENGKETYNKMKGTFIWEKNVTPVYAWYNGKVNRYWLGDPINKNGTTVIAKPAGDINDTTAKIAPFKLFEGNQPADSVNGYLLTPKTVGGYWKDYDWNKALTDGAKAAGLNFSGKYEFVKTETYMHVTHEVAPKDKALTCNNCHTENGVLDWTALGYSGDPMKVGGRSK